MPSELVVGILTIISGILIFCRDKAVVMTTEPRYFLLIASQRKTIYHKSIDPSRMVHLVGKRAAFEEGSYCKVA